MIMILKIKINKIKNFKINKTINFIQLKKLNLKRNKSKKINDSNNRLFI